ncbi:hypothetical protein CDD83_6601 [Cordyceps sp. RAO-2017]|nr:hypothetical protein CDD83_6601 [Cordyceps sp. RAO-2017]
MTVSSRTEPEPELDFSGIELLPLAEAEQIATRWLRPFLASPEQEPKTFHPHTLQFISCVLRSYPRQMAAAAGGDAAVPPIVHPKQLVEGKMPVALANGCSLIRLWQHRVEGSEAFVAKTVQQEMDRLARAHQEPGQDDHLGILASFQAYLLLCLTAYFLPLQGQPAELFNDVAMMALQETASRLAQSGLVCRAETTGSRPRWETWIVAAAKRRSLLAFYLFSNVYNAERQLPNYVASELRDLLAPEPKRLWAAASRAEFELEYARHVARWHDGPFLLSELWRSPESGSAARRERLDRWVETIDTFGMFVFTICAHIHGC